MTQIPRHICGNALREYGNAHSSEKEKRIVSYGETHNTHHSNHWNKDSKVSSATRCLQEIRITIYQHCCFLLCLAVCACKHVLSAPAPCLRISRWLAFLPGRVEQTALKGSPSVHPPAAPPAGWLRCWPEHWSLPGSNALEKKHQHNYLYFHKFNLLDTHILTDVTDQIGEFALL